MRGRLHNEEVGWMTTTTTTQISNCDVLQMCWASALTTSSVHFIVKILVMLLPFWPPILNSDDLIIAKFIGSDIYFLLNMKIRIGSQWQKLRAMRKTTLRCSARSCLSCENTLKLVRLNKKSLTYTRSLSTMNDLLEHNSESCTLVEYFHFLLLLHYIRFIALVHCCLWNMKKI